MPGKKSRKVGGKEEEEIIAALQKKTSLSATEIKEQYQEFKKMCPQGQVKAINENCHNMATSCAFPDDKETISGELNRASWRRGVFHGRTSFQVIIKTLLINDHHSTALPISSLQSCTGYLTMTKAGQWTLVSLSSLPIAQVSLTRWQKSGDIYL